MHFHEKNNEKERNFILSNETGSLGLVSLLNSLQKVLFHLSRLQNSDSV